MVALLFQVGTNIEGFISRKKSHYSELRLPLQPYVLVLGQSPSNVSQCFVVTNDVIYEVDTLLKAVDTCFKLFFVLNAQYPSVSVEPWLFLQKAVYKIDTPYDTTSSRLLELLSFIQQQ